MELSLVTKFLRFLDPNPSATFTGAWMHQDGSGVLNGCGVIFFKTKDIVNQWNALNGHCPALHVTLNQTKLTGRKTKHIESARVLCVDIDRGIDLVELEGLKHRYSPHMVVQSSPERYHLYWKIDPGIRLDLWKFCQLAFAEQLGGDKNLCHLTSLIRVPGFKRTTKDGEPFLPNVVWQAEAIAPHSYNQLLEAFNWIPKVGEQAKQTLQQERRKAGQIARRVLNSGHNIKDIAKAAQSSGRNSTLYYAIKAHIKKHGFISESEALSLGLDINNSFPQPLNEAEASRAILNAYRKAEKQHMLNKEQLAILSTACNNSASPINSSDFRLPEQNSSHTNGFPANIKHAASIFAQALLERNQGLGTNCFKACLSNKNYRAIANYFCEQFSAIGNFRQTGPSLCIKGNSKWGSEIVKPQTLTKDKFLSFAETALDELFLRVAESEQNQPSVLDFSSERCSRMAQVVWKATLIQPPIERQSADIIVYQNGVLDLRNGRFSEDLFAPLKYSHPIAANWDAKVAIEFQTGTNMQNQCPVFSKYMQDWFPNDPQTIEFILRWFGYCMTTDTSQQKFAFFYGPTAAGKGSISQILTELLGDNNCSSIEYKVLEGGFRAAEMDDKLLIVIEEVEATPQQHDICMAFLKKWTGGGPIQFERKYKDPFEAPPAGKLILQSNEQPKYQDKGGAIKRRMVAIGFEKSYPSCSGKEPSQAILEADADALATIAGSSWCKALRSHLPFSIKGSRALQVGQREITANIDPIQRMLDQYVKPDAKGQVSSGALIQLHQVICAERGIPQVSKNGSAIKNRVRSHFPRAKHDAYVTVNGRKVRGYIGISLHNEAILADFSDLEDDPERHGKLDHLLYFLGLSDSNSSVMLREI